MHIVSTHIFKHSGQYTNLVDCCHMPAERGDISNQEMLLFGTSTKARPQKTFVSTIAISPVIKNLRASFTPESFLLVAWYSGRFRCWCKELVDVCCWTGFVKSHQGSIIIRVFNVLDMYIGMHSIRIGFVI